MPLGSSYGQRIQGPALDLQLTPWLSPSQIRMTPPPTTQVYLTANTDLPFQFPVTSLVFQVIKLVNVLGSMYLSDHQSDFLHQNNEIVNENKKALHKHALILEVTAQPSCRLLTHKVQQMTRGSMSVRQ